MDTTGVDNSFRNFGWERSGKNRTVARGESRFEEVFFVLFVFIGDGSVEEEQI